MKDESIFRTLCAEMSQLQNYKYGESLQNGDYV